jgi:hypothetical protein
MNTRVRIALTLAGALLLPCLAAAATLRGAVTASHAPVAGARVMLHGTGADRATTTDSQGAFVFTDVAETRSLWLGVQAAGFETREIRDLRLDAGEDRTLEITLTIERVRTSVEVTQDPEHLGPASSPISVTLTPVEIDNIPSVSRAAAKYALLDPHVLQPLALGGDYQDANRLSINGASYRHTSYMLDGTTNYDWIYANNPMANVSAAAVDTVTVLTGVYSAQYGSSTSGIIAINTPAGTSELHGELFSYVRPSGIQATPALASFHVPNEKLDWGGQAGGPVPLRRRGNYFASYERVQQVRGAVLTSPNTGFYNGQANEYSGLLRYDEELNARHALTVRMNGSHFATDNANDRISGQNAPSYGRTARIQSWGGQAAERAQIGSAINTARFNFVSYIPDSATPLDPSTGVSVSNYLQAGYSTWSWVHAYSVTGGDLLEFERGRHSLKFGGEIEHLHARDYSYSKYGTYYYNTATDYANQNPYKYMQTYGVADIRYGQQTLNAFAQDEVKLTPRLMASLGVRYEFQSITDSLHNVAPRLGVQWDATGSGKTMLRAGAGMFFDQYYMYLNRRFITLGPHSPQYNYTWNCALTPNPCPTYPDAVDQPSGGTQAATVSYLYIPASELLNPYSLQFTAGIEHQLRPGTTITLSAMQAHTLHQMRVNDINHPEPFTRTEPGQKRSTTEANAKRPYSSYDGVSNVTLIDRIENSASSIFQSFDVALNTRGRWGEAHARYMMAGSYAYAMFYADYNSGVPSEWWPGWDRYERGPSDYYQRHHFVGDAVLHGPLRTSLSLVGNFGSGLPVNPITGVDNNGDGYTVDRPIGLGRDSYRAPMLKTVDASAGRIFALGERWRLDARVQALNLLNSKNFITVNNTWGNGAEQLSTFLAPKAGIGNTNPSRQLEFVARVRF